MLVAFSVAPSGTATPAGAAADGSVHDAVAAAVKVVRDSGLPHRTTSMFTEIEGEWDEVFAVVKAATDAVMPFGSRVSLVLKADIRPGRVGELDGKIERLETAIAALEADSDGGPEAADDR
ncbi:thiamine-binding protein [Microbacterium sp. B24]|uniref:thiamine-binding protein n=1 Tax=Microbacterium sp. B24 TaxID=95616 RepID=UPI0003FF3C78|nr:thiamine-binding protein [Microbacterium sp. B24]